MLPITKTCDMLPITKTCDMLLITKTCDMLPITKTCDLLPIRDSKGGEAWTASNLQAFNHCLNKVVLGWIMNMHQTLCVTFLEIIYNNDE